MRNIINEVSEIFNNIKMFRTLLNEGVGQQDIVQYIENHEWIYIYYTGDATTASGYRTIRPYVLGTSKAGNLVLRAWQDNPKNSWHFTNKPTRPKRNPDMSVSKNHDYWIDNEGMKPGWRMFRLDKIQKVYPTGKKFEDVNGLVMIPAGYHEGGDDDMTNVIAYVSTKKEPDFDYKYDKEVHGNVISKTEQNKAKWDSIRRGNKNSKKITRDDVRKLSDIASNVLKKGKGSFSVVIDDKQNYQLVTPKDIEKQNIPDSAVVGGLANLYDTFYNTNKHDNDTTFFIKGKDELLKNGKNKSSNEKISSIPFEKKTFFK